MGTRSFKITMKVPLGKREGRISWEEKGNLLEGIFDIMGYANRFTGKLETGHLSIEGTLTTLMRTIAYTAAGELNEGRLNLLLTEARHDYLIEGIEIINDEEVL